MRTPDLLTVLEQVVAINCSGFNDYDLPSHFETKAEIFPRGLDIDLDWGKNDVFLSDLSNFSLKSQKKMMMMKAMKEEEEICREVEKIVKWAKQASTWMFLALKMS
ncbi:unnamed protein product [Fraxinus pennsylvanica]|uniref:Uncharacterized protein n=1 Tax=Fraxinus pennsylvanica TaxID=56036 RepID=A0AAD2A2Q8_9LAMI|nr:unnamed protein product [Fraxinus pennsylvanica]